MKSKKPHYYYKYPKDSATGQMLETFFKACADAQEQARQWVEQQGGDTYMESPDGMAGGVSLVEFDEQDAPDGWERMDVPGGDVYWYPAPDSVLEQEMFALPVVSETKLIPILSLRPPVSKDGKPRPLTFGDKTPVVFRFGGYWYADVPYQSEAPEATSVSEADFHFALAERSA